MMNQSQRACDDIEEVIHRYQNAVYGLALVKTGSRADADDVFQEVFLAYYQSGKTFREEAHKKAWLLRTTINMSRRITSSTWRKKTVPSTQLTECGQDSMSAHFTDPEESRVWEALSALPGDYRVPLYLFYFQELSTQEIAKALSLRPGTVRMRLSRGRDQLRETLKGDDFDE